MIRQIDKKADYIGASKTTCLFLILIFLVTWTSNSTFAQDQIARGIVYHDVNNNQKLDQEDHRLSGVGVSNGRQITETDSNGSYELPIDDDTIIFLLKPKGFRTPLSTDQLPRFYYIHKPAGSPRLKFAGVPPTGNLPKSINFPLYSQQEPEKFQAILFGDPQSRDLKEIAYMNRDVIPELIGTRAAFGVTLGDILYDDLSLFDVNNKSVGLIGIPWYNVLGNHDLNFDSPLREHSNETFESFYGPSYYSFDYGNVHFVVLDNINWHTPKGEDSKYDGTFGEEQLKFLKTDLDRIPENQFVVLFMHIPLNDCTDAHALYRLIENRPLCFSVSAHRHYHQHRFLDKADGWLGEQPHHHVVNVTVSGSWWSGQKDERGIPHSMMPDGAPNGYSIVTFDGDHYTLDFKAAGRPTDYQLKIMMPDKIKSDEVTATKIWVNVFNGSEKSTVEMRTAGTHPWIQLEQVVEIDPEYLQLFEQEKKVTPPIKPELAEPAESGHLWRGSLPTDMKPGIHLFEIRTTDMHGRSYFGHRILRIVE